MSSSKQNGTDEEDNGAFDYYKHQYDASSPTPGSVKSDQLYSTCKYKPNEQCNIGCDDFNHRFMEQVYKERDTDDGWDRYLEIFQQHLESDQNKNGHDLDGVNKDKDDCDDEDNNTSSSDTVLDQKDLLSDQRTTSLNLGVTSDARMRFNFDQEKMKSTGSIKDSSSMTTAATPQEKVKSEKHKDIHYFRNGMCFYGNPEEHSERTKKQTDRNSGLDPSELKFYSNLRAYFGAAKPKTKETTSKSSESSSCRQERTKQNLLNHDVKKVPFPSYPHTKQNGVPSKELSTEEQQNNVSETPKHANGLESSSKSSTKHTGKQSNGEKRKQTILTKEQTISSENKKSSPTSSKELATDGHESCDLSSHYSFPKKDETCEHNSIKENCSKMKVESMSTESLDSSPKKISEDCASNEDRSVFTSFRDSNLDSSSQSDERSKTNSVASKQYKKSTDEESSHTAFKTGHSTCACTTENKDFHTLSPPLSTSKINVGHQQSVDSLEDTINGTLPVHKETQATPHNNTRESFQHSFSKTFQPENSPQQRSSHAKKPSNSDKKENRSSMQNDKDSFPKDTDKQHSEKPPRRSSLEKEELNTENAHEEVFRRTKRSHKNQGNSPHTSQRQSSASKLHRDRKARHKIPESTNEKHVPDIGRFARLSKEEMIGRISANERLESLIKRFLNSVKEICVKVFFGFLWLLYYSILIIAIIIVSLFVFGKDIVRYLYCHIMTWGVTMAIIDKLWLAKISIQNCYSIVKEFIRAKIYGPKRDAQTYNLPNTGDDAVQQLLVRQGPDNNPYRILGVPREASDEDIRKQYRKFAVLVHPDKNKHPHSAKAFQILTSAYDILGDVEKRKEYDKELTRKEQVNENPGFMKNPADYKDPNEFFADFMKQVEELKESLACNACQGRHRRIRTERSVIQARYCYDCRTMHQAKEGDFWKESRFLGIANGKFYTRTDNVIYDITEWGLCQERCGFQLPSDVHKVVGKITSRPPPRQTYSEADFFRDLFGHPNDFDGRHHNHRENHHKHRQQQQKSRRRKKK